MCMHVSPVLFVFERSVLASCVMAMFVSNLIIERQGFLVSWSKLEISGLEPNLIRPAGRLHTRSLAAADGTWE